MSHFTTIKTQIKDLEALRLACTELGLSLLQKAEARGYGGNKLAGDYTIKLKGPFDIAVQRQKEGAFGFTSDLWAGPGVSTRSPRPKNSKSSITRCTNVASSRRTRPGTSS